MLRSSRTLQAIKNHRSTSTGLLSRALRASAVNLGKHCKPATAHLATQHTSSSKATHADYLESKVEEIKKQANVKHPFFQYLDQRKLKGFNSSQYQVYRDNFLLRTSQTLPSVAKVIIAAAKQFDYKTLAAYGKNIFDETGAENPNSVHLCLLEDSYNLHGKTVFNISPINIREVSSSPLILSETIDFLNIQKKTYESDEYMQVLGMSYAQETAADYMLNEFYNTIFMPYRGYYTDTEFEKINGYFKAHIEGIEHEHGLSAKDAVMRACRNKADIDMAFDSGILLLQAQEKIWNGMLREMQVWEKKSGFFVIPDHMSGGKPALRR